MVRVRNISVKYKDEVALDDVSLDIEKGTTCAIIGPSGCGKTTLLYAIAGLININQGTICIYNNPLNAVRRETGVILQEYGLLPWKTVWGNIIFPLIARGAPKDKAKEIVTNILNELGIDEYKDKYPSKLSGGQKQRVAIARTLALAPDLLLMDEPSSSLDAMTKEHLQNLILEIYKQRHTTMVVVTHHIEEAVFLGEKIVVMSRGKVRHIIENPYFGMENLREDIDFYKFCLKVRRLIDEENPIC